MNGERLSKFYLKTKELLKKVFRYFNKEAKLGKSLFFGTPLKRLAKATGLTEITVRRYVQDEDPVQSVVKALHEEAVSRSVSVVKKLDDFDEGVVRRTIHGIYRNKEMVTMPKLHAALKEKDINVSLSTVVRTVKKLGFRVKQLRREKCIPVYFIIFWQCHGFKICADTDTVYLYRKS